MPDDKVLSSTVARDRVLITSDKDFGELVFVTAMRPSASFSSGSTL